MASWSHRRRLPARRRPSAPSAALAPRRLERRRMLDAAGGAMLLELLSEPDYVQAGPSSAEIGASQFDAAASQSNTPPSNLQLAPLAPVNEGGVALLQGTFDDPDAAGPHVVEINWGDDSPLQVITLSPSARSFSATHQYLDDNPTGTPSDQYTIQVRVIDPAGDAATATTTVTVNNVPPTNVLFQPLGTIDENGVATLNLSFTDPGTLDTHTVEINWGDGSPLETFTLPLGARTLTATHQYLDDNPTGTPQDMYAVTVRVIDDDGGQTTFTGPVTVRNVAPSNVQLAPVAPILEHGVATLQISFDDPGTLDVHRVEIDWGDGSPLETLLAPVGARSLTATHQYLDDHPSGTPQDDYLVRVRVLDDDGGASAIATTTVTVVNVPPTNVLFQPLGTI
ncbi:MAG TPA: hypothetical protein PKC18_14890, partial [Lacipirellulaceae bacterium]|nr:hypothetical protein [Lacipirellulaceae bacterium]